MLRNLREKASLLRARWKNSRREKSRKNFLEGETTLNVVRAFPAFAPNSWGSYRQRAALTIEAIDQIFPTLHRLRERSLSQEEFTREVEQRLANLDHEETKLADFFNRHGSDKANPHGYDRLYSALLNDPKSVKKVLEIGIGSNDPTQLSTMGLHGKPGASLRAFRDYFPSAAIYGADFDQKSLFQEERIQCYPVNQLDIDALEGLGESIGEGFDLMIDDGLHAPIANLNSLQFMISRLKPGGYAVIEDIHPKAFALWEVAASLLPNSYHACLLPMNKSLIFVVQKKYAAECEGSTATALLGEV